METILRDRDRGHWLATAELDGRNSTTEILASGHGGRVYLLARPPGYGRPEFVDPEEAASGESRAAGPRPGTRHRARTRCRPPVRVSPPRGRLHANGMLRRRSPVTLAEILDPTTKHAAVLGLIRDAFRRNEHSEAESASPSTGRFATTSTAPSAPAASRTGRSGSSA